MANIETTSGLVLDVTEASGELLRRMQPSDESGPIPKHEDLVDLTGRIVEGEPPAAVLTVNGWYARDFALVPGHLQSPDYIEALFKYLGYSPEEPRFKWAAEMRLSRSMIARQRGAMLINLINSQALETSTAIDRRVQKGQLEHILELTDVYPNVTMRIAPPHTFGVIGRKVITLIYPDGEFVAANVDREVHGYLDAEDLDTVKQPPINTYKLRQQGDEILTQAASAAGSRRIVERKLLEL